MEETMWHRTLLRMLITIAALATMMLGNGAAEPSKGISTLMKTPATVFDVFLLRVYEQSKCPHQVWFGVPSRPISSDVCMTSIEYSSYDNLIVMNFAVGNDHVKLQAIADTNDREKELVLKALISEVAQSVGTEPRGSIKKRFGMIQLTPIMADWSNSGLNSTEVREEIANRTVIHLRLPTGPTGDGTYITSRDQEGKVTFGKEEIKKYR